MQTTDCVQQCPPEWKQSESNDINKTKNVSRFTEVAGNHECIHFLCRNEAESFFHSSPLHTFQHCILLKWPHLFYRQRGF